MEMFKVCAPEGGLWKVVTGLRGSENEVAAVGGKRVYAAWAYDTDKIMMDNYDVCVVRLKYSGNRSFRMCGTA
jgi:hypothetical protein